MCKFKVTIENDRQILVENIVKASYEGNTLKLVNVLGEAVMLENAIISEIDVSKEEMKILNHPLLGATLMFLTAFLNCQNKTAYDPLVEELWNRVKSLGELMLRELWAKRRGARK